MNFQSARALNGTPASADDLEMDQGDKRVPLEIWASPIKDDEGNVNAAVAVFQDITQRKQAEAELALYQKQLEQLVNTRTTELDQVNQRLQLRLEWLVPGDQGSTNDQRRGQFGVGIRGDVCQDLPAAQTDSRFYTYAGMTNRITLRLIPLALKMDVSLISKT